MSEDGIPHWSFILQNSGRTSKQIEKICIYYLHISEIIKRNTFLKIMDIFSRDPRKTLRILISSCLDTDLGPMMAITDESQLYLLEYIDHHGLERKIQRLKLSLKAAVIPGTNAIIQSIDRELKAYFSGELRNFTTPYHLIGTPFQKLAWKTLIHIPYGETQSYAAQAASIQKSSAYRAVANANGANQIPIVIPCHRIIKRNGDLGGYGGGIIRKQWLINHERKYEYKY
jgi:AraC family transcriptional regulator of adaptative response/methylated-DNA-[protein]-cysteine methyltransferase